MMSRREHPLDRAYRRYVAPLRLSDGEHAWLARNFDAIRGVRPIALRQAFQADAPGDVELSRKVLLLWGVLETLMSRPHLVLAAFALPTVALLAFVAHLLFGTPNPFGAVHG
ncbi:hypothetical protein [Burkholderia gladioli]|uniref:hypothetical protein n=1 Tax=Burkholderia gladioli TaxID=28095 RepID=UPI001364C1E1|nr:hypothetical protein [Burkholderia gladioli]KAF1060802.1 hypothetical protein LvStA_04077 [Burkholderia gladioli]